MALAIGVALQAGLVAPAVRVGLWPAYVHLITIGWLTGFIFGVAWWLFPRLDRSSPDRTPIGWVSYGLLNGGLVLRAIAEPLAGIGKQGDAAGVLLLISAIAQLAGVAAFAAIIWARVRTR